MRFLLALLAFVAINSYAQVACVPGSGHDYQVGTAAGQISAAAVPWNALAPGDTVRFFTNGSPYHTNFAVNAIATPSAPVLICGVPNGTTGAKPVLEANGATVAPQTNWGRASAAPVNQSETPLWIGSKDTDADVRAPANIIVSGLVIRDSNPTFNYVGSDGATHGYNDFGACLWVGVGHNITFDGNELYNCSQGVYVRSQDNGNCNPSNVGTCPNISTGIVIRNNIIDGYGVSGDDHEHGMYIEAVAPVIEKNWIKQPWPNAGGNAIKDRSVGPIIRYNTINSGSRAFDLVEAEDFPTYALSDPLYRKTYVYGNLVNKTGDLGLHYGFDNAIENDRQGTLYLWDNTFDLQGTDEGAAYLLKLETINDHAQMWNNVYKCDLSATRNNYRCALRLMGDEGSGGTVNLGVNWVDNSNGNCVVTPFCDGDGVRAQQPTGPLTGASNLITGLASPLDSSFIPIASGAADNRAQAQLPDVSAFPVQFENSTAGVVSSRPSVADLGAIETGGSPPPQCPPMPAQASQTVQCPAGTTGTWTQTHGWDSAPFPTCWTAQAWQPTSAPPGACTAANQPPVAQFGVVVNGATVTVTDQSTDADGTITSRAWNFGDGSTGSGTPVAHTYAASGTYTISLTVTDNGGATGSVSHPVTVTVPPPPSLYNITLSQKKAGGGTVSHTWNGVSLGGSTQPALQPIPVLHWHAQFGSDPFDFPNASDLTVHQVQATTAPSGALPK